jgi:predicted nucleic acid-binding protein
MIIYDSSAFFDCLLDKSVNTGYYILDLTYYEIGNVVLKHLKKLKTIDEEQANSLIDITGNWNNVLFVQRNDLQEIFKIASKLEITYYDATYVYFTKKHNAALKTSDKELYEKSKKFCRVELMSI